MKTVTICGVGALGSHVVQFLRSENIEFRLIDFDRIEQKNVMSQFHSKPSVGKLKGAALTQQMKFLFGRSGIKHLDRKLEEGNCEALLKGSDIVVDCFDNGEARRLVQGFVRAKNIACVHGALAADGTFGRVIWDKHFRADDAAAGQATCEDGEHLPHIASVASYLALAVQKYLKDGTTHNFQITPQGVIRV